ncbi:MAG: ABC transporter ATP-binding protein [Lachnospiraceae bacterium]|nr:ABC transporter ATP-binding protein [Lachnospiraceae bacterium]
MGKTIVLEMKNISKIFGTTIANDNVNLQLHRGEIHALLGENGAGKSTLMNILLGIYKPNTGSIYFNGKQIFINNPKAAAEIGIGMVHQHFELISTLSVTENIYLSMEHGNFVLNKAKMEAVIKEYAEKFGLPVDPGAKIWQLSVGEQQRVEILKLLCGNREILILDEPSAVLTPQEANEMFRTLRRMADDGKSVIFISHKMNEVMEHADRITVLKGGKIEDEMLAKDATVERLTKAVIGSRTLDKVTRKVLKEKGQVLLEVQHLLVNNDKGLIALNDISFQLHSGEIFAIAGVAGNGQRELAEAIAGLRKVVDGKLIMNGKEITKTTVKQRISKGISFIPEDRLKMGLVPEMDIKQNAVLKVFGEPLYSKCGMLKKKSMKEIAKTYITSHEIKNGGIQLPVSMMSGGNQQKLLVAREVNGDPILVIAAYPVRGLDIGAASAINKILIEQSNKGACILLISEELDEIFEMSDRVAVLCDGKLMGIRNTGQTNYDEIGRMMSGELE